MTHPTVTLNADLGEGFDYDDKIMPLVDIANIACGGHAGDEQSMRQTLLLASQYNVAISAHPGYPDRENFGRQSTALTTEALRQTLHTQLLGIQSLASELGCTLTYIKPHGALYNDCACNAAIAQSFLDICLSFDDTLTIIGLANSRLTQLASSMGISYLAEGFIDRRYQRNGQLVPRSKAQACIDDIDTACAQALQIVRHNQVTTICQQTIPLNASTLCLHGDSAQALALAQHVAPLLAPYRQAIDTEPCAPQN